MCVISARLAPAVNFCLPILFVRSQETISHVRAFLGGLRGGKKALLASLRDKAMRNLYLQEGRSQTERPASSLSGNG